MFLHAWLNSVLLPNSCNTVSQRGRYGPAAVQRRMQSDRKSNAHSRLGQGPSLPGAGSCALTLGLDVAGWARDEPSLPSHPFLYGFIYRPVKMFAQHIRTAQKVI